MAANGQLSIVYFQITDGLEHVVFHLRVSKELEMSTPIALATVPSNSRIGAQYSFPSADRYVELGSRIALYTSNETVIAAWPDTRNSRDAETGQQEVFAATFRLSRSETTSRQIVVGGVLLALALLVVVIQRVLIKGKS